MNKWQERADECKKQLEEAQKWIEEIGFSNIPDGLKTIIVRGELLTEEKIEKYQEWAKEEESTKA